MKTKLIILFLVLIPFVGSIAQSAEYIQAQAEANNYVVANRLHYHRDLNIYTGHNDSVIHIFMFEDGNLLLAGYPTTATEKSKFQVHLFVRNANRDPYILEYTGSYSPILNIQSANESSLVVRLAGQPPIINRMDFAILGPFTDSLILTVKKFSGSIYNTLTSSTIKIAKTIYASIGSGIVYTSLKDPSNIRKVPLAAGDSTLVADNARGRSLLTVMATFYPWGRNNLMMPSWSFKDRFGIVVGTTIGSQTSTFKNLLIGGQYDFSIGGSIVAGLHYGQRQKILGVDYDDFEFGKTKFSGDLESKKYTEGDIGVFVGVALDTRIFSQLFK